MTPVTYDELPGWQRDNHKEALAAFLRSCQTFSALPSDRLLMEGRPMGAYRDWQEVCQEGKAFVQGDEVRARHFFESRFNPFLVSSWMETRGRFTGYFEIGLKGSKTRHGPYQYPIYKLPTGMDKKKPYFTRKEIDEGVLAGKGLELCWVDDPVRLFFLHVQGSGQVVLEDGKIMRIGYAGKNGHAYASLGRFMIDNHLIEEKNLSADSVKQWLYTNPAKAKEVMAHNASYVFFKEIKGDGPVGAQGIALTEERSLAIDKRYLPYGTPIWLNVTLAATPNYPKSSYHRLMIAQDTGSAIRGSVRGDIFFGAGVRAEERAGYTNTIGTYYILLPLGVL